MGVIVVSVACVGVRISCVRCFHVMYGFCDRVLKPDWALLFSTVWLCALMRTKGLQKRGRGVQAYVP